MRDNNSQLDVKQEKEAENGKNVFAFSILNHYAKLFNLMSRMEKEI